MGQDTSVVGRSAAVMVRLNYWRRLERTEENWSIEPRYLFHFGCREPMSQEGPHHRLAARSRCKGLWVLACAGSGWSLLVQDLDPSSASAWRDVQQHFSESAAVFERHSAIVLKLQLQLYLSYDKVILAAIA